MRSGKSLNKNCGVEFLNVLFYLQVVHVFIDEKDLSALIGMGASYLAKSDRFMDVIDGTDEQEHKVVPLLEAGKNPSKFYTFSYHTIALEWFRKAMNMCQELKKDDISLMCMMGETLVNLGNFNAEGEDDVMFYKEAVDLFKRIRSINANDLPPEFASLIDEWEADME